MGMSIQEILAAQQRAAKATCKYKAPVVTQTKAATQAKAASVAELIERQRITAAAQKASRSGVSPVLSANQKAVIDSIRGRYNTFLAKLDKELEGQELFMPPPAPAPVEETPAEPIFTPNVPASENLVVEATEAPAGVNGISVGEELGGQVAITTRLKRKRKAKAVNQKSEPTVEPPAVEA